jgi:hypothetical protein
MERRLINEKAMLERTKQDDPVGFKEIIRLRQEDLSKRLEPDLQEQVGRPAEKNDNQELRPVPMNDRPLQGRAMEPFVKSSDRNLREPDSETNPDSGMPGQQGRFEPAYEAPPSASPSDPGKSLPDRQHGNLPPMSIDPPDLPDETPPDPDAPDLDNRLPDRPVKGVPPIGTLEMPDISPPPVIEPGIDIQDMIERLGKRPLPQPIR